MPFQNKFLDKSFLFFMYLYTINNYVPNLLKIYLVSKIHDYLYNFKELSNSTFIISSPCVGISFFPNLIHSTKRTLQMFIMETVGDILQNFINNSLRNQSFVVKYCWNDIVSICHRFLNLVTRNFLCYLKESYFLKFR